MSGTLVETQVSSVGEYAGETVKNALEEPKWQLKHCIDGFREALFYIVNISDLKAGVLSNIDNYFSQWLSALDKPRDKDIANGLLLEIESLYNGLLYLTNSIVVISQNVQRTLERIGNALVSKSHFDKLEAVVAAISLLPRRNAGTMAVLNSLMAGMRISDVAIGQHYNSVLCAAAGLAGTARYSLSVDNEILKKLFETDEVSFVPADVNYHSLIVLVWEQLPQRIKRFGTIVSGLDYDKQHDIHIHAEAVRKYAFVDHFGNAAWSLIASYNRTGQGNNDGAGSGQ